MANKQKLALVTSDDWQAIYIDNKKFEENHSIPTYVWVKLVGEGPYEISLYSIDDEDFIEDIWGYDFPKELDESQIQEYKID